MHTGERSGEATRQTATGDRRQTETGLEVAEGGKQRGRSGGKAEKASRLVLSKCVRKRVSRNFLDVYF